MEAADPVRGDIGHPDRLNIPFDSAFKYYLERGGFVIVECGPDFGGKGL